MADLKFNNVTPTTGSLKVGSNDVSKVYLGSTQVWPITLVTDPNTGIYGTFTHLPDDTQSGTANVYSQTNQTSFNSIVSQNRVATSLITDSTFNVFRFKTKVNNGNLTMNSVQIFAYSDSARTTLVTQTSLWNGPATMTGTYQDPWGSLTLSTPGTYFLKISFNLTATGSGNQQGYQLTLT
jgi:hypothetical protein